MPLSTGDTIGPYQILARIGEGGMGEVFRARDTRLDRTVAIKVSKAEFSDRFAREAKSVAALNHPNICTLHDVGRNYLVMELIEGTPLKGPLPVEKAVEYAGQILDALDAAHRKGFVHQDLKPANVMVTRHGIKLLDFGLARRTAPPAETDATHTAVMGGIEGTPQYMAPELLQGRPADARSDLFAFGCVLYELLSGKRAFEGQSMASVIAAILEREPAPLELHPPLDRVIRKCLAKDPDERFQTARDLKTALAWAIEQPAAPAKMPRWPWAIAAAMLVVGAMIGGVVMRSRQTSEQVQRFQLNPPEGAHFNPESGFALSPDGRTLAFVATAQGKSGLWVRPIDGTAARLLPGTLGAFYPMWSPDGRSLAYGTANKLWRIDVVGGSPVAVCDAPFFVGGDWSQDGVIVYAAGQLRRASASGGAAEVLTSVDTGRGETTHWSPHVLPGGRILFYIAGRPEVAGIYAAPLANPRERVRLVATNSPGVYAAGQLLWLRGSTLLAQRLDATRLTLSGEPRPIADPVGAAKIGRISVAASSNGLLVHGQPGSAQLTWVDREGKAAGSASNPAASALGEPGHYLTFRLSPNGHRVAVGRESGSGRDLWMVDVERGAWSRFTFLPGFALSPVWSPDGRQVIFKAIASPFNLYRKEASGAGAEQRMTTSANSQVPLDWSRDGRLVLYTDAVRGKPKDLWVLPMTPDGKADIGGARPFLQSRFNEDDGRFSPEPNPRWVAYTSDESGRDEVYVQALSELRGKFQISTGGGRFPEWSPDGRELFYLSADNKLMAAGVKLGNDSVMPSTPARAFRGDP
jgi:Tol biopolymer transport system component/predicted Ser/Thr protein kinase